MSGFRVYKLGGPALEDPAFLALLAREVTGASTSCKVVLVHGGGRRVERVLEKLKVESRFVAGRRETSVEAMEVVEMVLSGTVNKELASGLSRAGLPAVGLSGRDGGLIAARPLPLLGRVGAPETVDSSPLNALWDGGYVPVVSPVADGPAGEPLNVNADEAALGLARALGARTLVYLSDTDGVRTTSGLAGTLSAAEAARLISDGTITGGMALKVQVALEAASTVPEVLIAGPARLQGGFPGTRILGEARS